jgi:hypothetical protein
MQKLPVKVLVKPGKNSKSKVTRVTTGRVHVSHPYNFQDDINNMTGPMVGCHVDQSNGATWHLREGQVGLESKWLESEGIEPPTS